jgi:hypothetical protein
LGGLESKLHRLPPALTLIAIMTPPIRQYKSPERPRFSLKSDGL